MGLVNRFMHMDIDDVRELVTDHGVDLLVLGAGAVAVNLNKQRRTTFEVLRHDGRRLLRTTVDLAAIDDVIGATDVGTYTMAGGQLSTLLDVNVPLDTFAATVEKLAVLCGGWRPNPSGLTTTPAELFVQANPSFMVTVDHTNVCRGYLVNRGVFTNVVDYTTGGVDFGVNRRLQLGPELVTTAYAVVDGGAALVFINKQADAERVFRADAAAGGLLRAYVPMGDEVWVDGWPAGYAELFY